MNKQEPIYAHLDIGLSEDIQIVKQDNKLKLLYYNEESETISRESLYKLSQLLDNKDTTLYTNSGIDLHQSEDELYGIKIQRFSYTDYDIIKDGLYDC